MDVPYNQWTRTSTYTYTPEPEPKKKNGIEEADDNLCYVFGPVRTPVHRN